jgi:hypothetical protein
VNFCHHKKEEEEMKNQFLVLSTIMVTILFTFPITPQAKEQTIDLTICAAGTCDNLSEAKDWETESCELRGIGWSNNGYEPLETFTTFGKCILGIKNGKWDMDCFKKYLDSDGDYIIIRNTYWCGYKSRHKQMPVNH